MDIFFQKFLEIHEKERKRILVKSFVKLLGIERTDTWLDIDEHTNVHDLEESINIKVQLQKQLIE